MRIPNNSIFLDPTACKIPKEISHKAIKEEDFKQIDKANHNAITYNNKTINSIIKKYENILEVSK